jgi:hypothetical protein
MATTKVAAVDEEAAAGVSPLTQASARVSWCFQARPRP